MGGADSSGDDRTFKVSFTSDGLSRLSERVKEKLKEFIGDYTDDTLVDYVVVLLRNGRRKDEARKELDVFLGDDSTTFVSWLWDHLSSNMHLYTQQKQSFPDEAANSKLTLKELSGRNNSQEHPPTSDVNDSGHDREKSSKISRSRHSRGQKGIAQENNEIFPLRSVVTNILHAEDKACKPHVTIRSHSPRIQVQRKRNRDDEYPPTKQRDSASYPKIDAPRRLLQFAVRDAVKTVRQSNSRGDPDSKRLCSVVSTGNTDSLPEAQTQRKSGFRMSSAVSSDFELAAEDTEDANKARSSSSVFDRLGHGRQLEERDNQLSGYQPEESEYDDNNQIPEPVHLTQHSRSEYDKFDDNMTVLETETCCMSADCSRDNDEYDRINVQHDLDASRGVSSINKGKKLVMAQYSIPQKPEDVQRKRKLMDQERITEEPEEISRKRRSMDQEPSIGSATLTSKKIVNISVNVNTWKPSHYQVSKNNIEVETAVTAEKTKVGTGSQNAKLSKENDVFAAQNLKDVEHAEDQRMSTKKPPLAPGSYTTGRPLEDVDSRTLFVSNVHFAASKDTLSRHFNKFGDVLKVIIIADVATGQPTGSAYVEFLKKESADLALSLNGTSFMSRILKVVRRSSHEAAPVLSWPRIARAPSFASRHGRIPYPRGVLPGAFRGRPPIKPGARSLQWKRETSAVQPNEGAKSSLTFGNNVLSPTARSLTYTRTETKPDGPSGTT